jgi:TRAP-type mannitol/chloroaromatic compound transport system permease large subunit
MSPQEWLAVGLLVGFFALLMAGVPVGITLATSGVVFGFMGFGETLFALLPARIYGVVANYQWLAIPLFVFMGVMLEKSRLAEDLPCPPCCAAATTRPSAAAQSARRARSARSSRPAWC